MKPTNSFGPFGWLGLIILLGFLFFKWIPDWTWQAKAPEITINDYIFEAHPVWQGDNAVLSRSYPPNIYIRIQPEEAADSRAKLTVSINGNKVDENCSYGSKYFCYKITNAKNDDRYEIVAKNTAGEKHVTLDVKTGTGASGSSGESSNSSSDSPAGPESREPSQPSSNNIAPAPSTVPYVKSSSCLHYEAGRCWDDLENEMYSNGLYDHSYGYYGGSYIPPDDCNQTCQDILEDAYEEGYYDF